MRTDSAASETAEMAVIGAVLMDGDIYSKIATICTPSMFESEPLRECFAAFAVIHGEGVKIDVVSAIGKLGGGYKQILTKCAESVPSISSAEAYAAIVCEQWRRRFLKERLYAALGGCEDGDSADVTTAKLNDLAVLQNEVAAQLHDEVTKDMAASIDDFLKDLSAEDTSIKTGMQEFDSLGCLERGNAVIIAGRPGGGKTDFAISMAAKLALKYRVLYFSLEMSNKQLTRRIISSSTSINSALLRSKKLTENEMAAAIKIGNFIKTRMSINIDERSGITPEYIAGKIAQYKPDVIFVDHIGLMGVANKKKSEYERLSEVTHALKAFAKANDIVVFELCQLNRQVDKTNGRASMADFKGSGTIEEDSDVAFVLRPEPRDSDEPMDGDEMRMVHMDILKNRSGIAGVTIDWAWRPQYSSFTRIVAGDECAQERM